MFDDIYLVTDRLRRCSITEIDELKQWMPQSPPGHEEYLQKLGIGEYCSFVYIWPPSTIADEIDAVRKHVVEQVEFVRTYHNVPDVDFSKSIPIASTKDGDYLVVHPQSPDTIFGIARQDFAVYLLPDGFNDLLAWVRFHDNWTGYTHQPPFRYFESEEDRVTTTFKHRTMRDIPCEETAQFLYERFLGMGQCRRIDDEAGFTLFPKAIQGHVSVHSFVNMTYDPDFQQCVNEVALELERFGFEKCSHVVRSSK